MTRIERRVLTNCVLIGTLLTFIVLMADSVDLLQVTENWMYDLRARHFQYFQSPPTDQLIHLDIDDKALESIGRWPWPRSQMAKMVDEIHLAGARAVAMDILFTEPQDPTYEVSQTETGQTRVDRRIDHDDEFAAAVRRAGNVLIPASFEFESREIDPAYAALVKILQADPDLTEKQAIDALDQSKKAASETSAAWTNLFLQARHEAVYRRIQAEFAIAPLTVDQTRHKLITHSDTTVNSPLSRLIDDQWALADAARRLSRFGTPAPAGAESFLKADVKLAPIARLSSAAAATAFVDFKTARDGVLRTQPLVLNCNGRLYPQMGLSLALLYLGATEKDLTHTAGETTIHCPDGRQIVMPTTAFYSDTLGRNVSGIFQIPFVGDRHWETMYDWPNHQVSRQHMSMNVVNDVVRTREKIHENNVSADEALLNWSVYRQLPPDDRARTDDAKSRLHDLQSFLEDAQNLLELLESSPPGDLQESDRRLAAMLKAYNNGNPNDKAVAQLPKPEQKIVDNLMIAKSVVAQNPRLGDQLEMERKSLHDMLNGKAIFIGWTATGHQDAVPTSLHASCPGVVTHGAIFNAIVSGHFWTVAPKWVTLLFTVALGLFTAVIAWRFSPLVGFLITSAFGMGYVVLNGLLFFDHWGQIVGLAAPQIAMGSVWSGCTLARMIVETSERQRIVRHFRSYVDPNVVNYMMERPDEVRMDGETRELTVCFLDIAGFTALSERLGNDIVPMLNSFMDLMVPIIREQHGTVDKLLGDGIMFFYGAPEPQSSHASDAVATALLMQQAVARFNADLAGRGLPKIGIRIGINTGLMIVGDAGSDDYADYTVLGDNVNLASRLESANKQLGTSILISARTAELAGERFLLRPIGTLQVVGKTEGVKTFTVCGLADGADSKEIALCEKQAALVASFRKADFAGALATVAEIDQTFGPSTVTGLYRALCNDYLVHPPGEAFDGKITFKEK